VGSNKGQIVSAARCFEPARERADVFGKGDASIKIVELVEKLAVQE
jgi:hypothetical protein